MTQPNTTNTTNSSETLAINDERLVKTVCTYCGVGCGMVLHVKNNQVVKITGDKNHPANFGKLCTKGQTANQFINHPDRLNSAWVKDGQTQELKPSTTAQAIQQAAQRFKAIYDQYGAQAISFYVSGQMSLESQYLINKLAKGYLKSNTVESNSRLCMASAGAGYKLSLGADAPPGSYQDFEHCDVFMVIGANMADCHPILYLRMMQRISQGAKLIVVDPRQNTTASKADLYLSIKPSTDLAFLNGLLYLLIKNNHIDQTFINANTQGWDQLKTLIEEYTPPMVSELTGISVAELEQVAQLIGTAKNFMTLWTMGLNQSTKGTWNTNAICNLHLATGKICKLGSGPFSLTGQPNAMGGREMGYMGAGLPGQRSVLVHADRQFAEQVWQLPPNSINSQVGGGTIDLFEQMQAGIVKACWIICTNPVASVANRQTVINGLKKAELVICQDVFKTTETNAYADIILPATVWAEAQGTMVNSERNVTLMQPAVSPPSSEVLPDWQMICHMAQAMGFNQGFNFDSAAAVFEEIKQFANPKTDYSLQGMSYAALTQQPMQWPCVNENQPSNPIRYVVQSVNDNSPAHLKFATDTGKAQFWARQHLPAAELPSADYPFILNTGRLQHQWHTLTKTGKVATLNKLNPAPFIEIHPQTAQQLGIVENQAVQVTSKRGSAILPAKISNHVQPDQCFAPLHWNDCFGQQLCINAVTNDAIDPISQQPEFKYCAVQLTALSDAQVDFHPATTQTTTTNTFKQGTNLVQNAQSLPSASQPTQINRQINGLSMKQLSQMLNVSANSAPQWTADEQAYLAGLLQGLSQNNTADVMQKHITIGEGAPFSVQNRHWLNGFFNALCSPSIASPSAQSANTSTTNSTTSNIQLTLIYASQTGNSEALAQQLASQLKPHGINATVIDAMDATLSTLQQPAPVVFVLSTFGDGEQPDSAHAFWQLLQHQTQPLNTLHYAIIALGDSSYAQFCGFGKKVEQQLQQLQANALQPLLTIDGDYTDNENQNRLSEWVKQLASLLQPYTAHALTQSAALLNVQNHSPAKTKYTKNNPYPATIVAAKRLNGDSSNKDIRQMAFAINGNDLPYQVGDALGVWPQNDMVVVQSFAQLLQLNLHSNVQLNNQTMTLEQALQTQLDITKPHYELLEWLADAPHNQTLKTLLAEKADLTDWLWGKQTLDILLQYPPVQTTAQQVVDRLKKLQPRLYSISSSSLLSPNVVHLTISAVQYQTTDHLGQTNLRKGVASNFLAHSQLNQAVNVFVQPSAHFKPPTQSETPLIMVGPGTGIAPFIGFLQQRQALGHMGKNWLFFGEQHAATDFYYKDELESFLQTGLLTHLSLAFSRDQAQKVYVQHKMLEAGETLWQWLQNGAYFCVCGDANKMAKDVDHALRQIIAQYGQLDEAQTQAYINQLIKEKRYLKDVY